MADAKEEPINISVKGSDSAEVQFKIKKKTIMSKLIKAYCDKKSIAPSSIRFVFDGARVQGDVTAEALGLEDGDVIDVFQEQTGGC